MNKKQEALRRGLRSFIEDTSRELADLEGREITRRVPSPVDGGSAPGTGASDAPVLSRPIASAAVDVSVRPAGEEPVAPPVRPAQAVFPQPSPPPSVSPPIVPVAPQKETLAESDLPPGPSKPPRAGQMRKRQPREARRRPPGEARRRQPQHAVPGLGIDGVNAQQALARKGVCFAYFVNEACWRVPAAYCNTALQVCIKRECPVYHLHKGAMERRFARKFKHFW